MHSTDKKTALWKRYPNRRGAARFQAYFTPVEVLETEIRKVRKCYADHTISSFEVDEEWSRIKVKGRSKWVPSKEIHSTQGEKP